MPSIGQKHRNTASADVESPALPTISSGRSKASAIGAHDSESQSRSRVSWVAAYCAGSGTGVKRLLSLPLVVRVVSVPTCFLAACFLLLLPFLVNLATTAVSVSVTSNEPPSPALEAHAGSGLLPSPPPRSYPLNSTTVASLFDDRMNRLPPDRFPWSGMLPWDTAFSAGAKYMYFRRALDDCVGFIHHTASLRCRMVLAERLNRTLLVDAAFCTARTHTKRRRKFVKPLYAYYDMDVIRA